MSDAKDIIEQILKRSGRGGPRGPRPVPPTGTPGLSRRPVFVGLGASVLEERDGYTILTDPGGMVFCVVPVQSGDHFARHATTWR